MEIVLLQSAQTDLLELISTHGNSVYTKVDDALEIVRTHPESAPVYRFDFRRKLVTATSFGVFYKIQGHRVFISYVLDLR